MSAAEPLVPERPEAGKRPVALPDAPSGATAIPGRILVVDDSLMNRQTLGRLLGGLGHDVIEADNGRVALDLLGDDGAGIDVVLLDLVMP